MMTNILENRFAIELLYYLMEEPNKSFAVTKLKELTRFSNRSIYSCFETLISYNIVIQEKTKYRLNSENELTYKIIELLKEDKKKFKFISTRDFLKIKQIMKFLESEKFEKVYLFGSYARGSQNVNSDIDIAIFSKNELNVVEWQLYFENKKIKVEFHLFKKEDKNNSLQKKIFEEGVLLLEK